MSMAKSVAAATALAAVLVIHAMSPAPAAAQRGGRGGFNQPDPNLPTSPTAVALATISRPVTGPGTMYQSVQSLPPGRGLDHYGYEATEYFVSGIAAGAPYKTRIVVRKPASTAGFSGLVLTEAMHPSGSAHMFEFTSNYLMASGHAAVEVVTGGLNLLTDHNKARYADISVAGNQVSEILAQVGALLKEGGANSPLSGQPVRKTVMGGTSATSAILVRYLPAHMVYRTPGMRQIYDGYLPHSNGTTMPSVDVPLIQIPTMTEVRTGTATARQDGDAPGDQYRLYEFAGMAHVDSRDSVRLHPDPCVNPVTLFPLQAYVSVGLDHLFKWVDAGVTPPRAPRVLVDRNTSNDGSLMALDAHGNPIGGIRNPYVDVPTAKNGVPNQGATPVIANASAYVAAGGQAAANQMCGLAGYQIAMSKDTLRTLYDNKANYTRLVQAKVDEMEAAGWSLPVYRELILADASAVDF
jgi:hypothetical protein